MHGRAAPLQHVALRIKPRREGGEVAIRERFKRY
jgi:hypothetical protein